MKRLSYDSQQKANEVFLLMHIEKSAKHFNDVADFFYFEITKWENK